MQKCDGCPSFVPADQVAMKFNKHTGTAMCARYAKVLGHPSLSQTAAATLLEYNALGCEGYGKPAPEKPERWETAVAISDPKTLRRLGTIESDDLTTCRSCVNLVRSEVVQAELGFPNDLCRATGKLILRPQVECKGCPFAERGPSATTTAGIELLPQFMEGFTVPTRMAVDFVVGKSRSDVDPADYPSDLPVTEEDEAEGIRAWRYVEPGDEGNDRIPIPLFRRDLFTPDEQELIPQTGDDSKADLYVDHQNLLYDFAANCYRLGEAICLEGEPGTGKTQFVNFAAWIMQMPFVLFAYDSETVVDDMLGKMGVDEQNGASVTTFRPGRITEMIQRPTLICHDEYNVAENAIKEALRTIFNGGSVMVVDRGDRPYRVVKHLYNFNVVCQNAAWDLRNIGTKQMAMADMDRLSPISVTLPPESIERHIITEYCKLDGYDIPAKTLDLIMKITADLREYSKQQTVPFTFGIRQTIKVGRKTRYYKVLPAFRKSVLDFYGPEVMEVCQGVFDSYITN